MASIAYPTTLTIPGPWLLDPQNLRSLDNVVDACLRRMSEARDAEFEAACSRRKTELLEEGRSEEEVERSMKRIRPILAEQSPAARRRTTVYLSGGKAAHGSQFAELAGLPTEHDETPRGFSIHARAGSAEMGIQLRLGRWESCALEVDVSAADKRFAMELFGELQNWATDLQPPRWQQIWRKARYPVSCALIMWFLASLILIASLRTPVLQPAPTLIQAQRLAQRGVTPATEDEALQLILEIESGYDTQPITTGYRPVSGVFLGVYLIVLLSLALLLFPPRGAVGLWRGRRAVRRQRIWSNAVSASIPLLLLGSVILPALAHRMGLT